MSHTRRISPRSERSAQDPPAPLARSTADTELDALTSRERETLELIAQARSNAAIARELVVTLGPVEKHISNIFAKLDLPVTDDDHRRVLAVLTYLRATS
jgi:DNA-binding NarL/FixJ family response regulator